MVPNARLRDAGIRGARSDKAMEAPAYGLPLKAGVPIFVDITLVSSIRSDGSPIRGADITDGIAISKAKRQKRNHKYPELAASPDSCLQVVALEVGGRWSDNAVSFLRELAWAKARVAPSFLRAAAAYGWLNRWSNILAVAAQGSLAATLLGWEPASTEGFETGEPSLSGLLASAPSAVAWSRLSPTGTA